MWVQNGIRKMVGQDGPPTSISKQGTTMEGNQYRNTSSNPPTGEWSQSKPSSMHTQANQWSSTVDELTRTRLQDDWNMENNNELEQGESALFDNMEWLGELETPVRNTYLEASLFLKHVHCASTNLICCTTRVRYRTG